MAELRVFHVELEPLAVPSHALQGEVVEQDRDAGGAVQALAVTAWNKKYI